MKDIYDLVGRLLIAFFFLVQGIEYLIHFKDMKVEMISYHITWQPNLWLAGAIFLLIFGSLLVGFGYRIRFGAILLLLFWIPMTFIIHPFWRFEGIEYHEELKTFMANLAITGGLFIVAVHKSGKYAVKKLFATTKIR
ncbi:MAG TPA: DoxX family protein [Saprospiraceae bacterium]|nr:DoxX family protein [Saprospiraceae bacterium]